MELIPYISNLLVNLSASAVAIYIPVLIKGVTGSTLHVGWIASLYFLIYFLAGMFFGRLGDFFQRKWLIIGGAFVTGISVVGLSFANSYNEILIFRLLNGLGLGMIPGALTAFVYEKKGDVGVLTALGSFGWAGGALLFGFVGFHPELFVSAGIIAMIPGVLFVKTGEFPFKSSAKFLSLGVLKKNFTVYFVFFLRHVGAFAIWTIYPLFLIELGATPLEIAIIYGINPLLQFIFMLHVKKLRPEIAIILGLISSVITFSVFALVRNYQAMIPLQIPLALSWSMLWLGSLYYLLRKNLEHSTASGSLNALSGLCGMIGGVAGGYLANYSLRLPMILASATAGIALLLFLSNKRI